MKENSGKRGLIFAAICLLIVVVVAALLVTNQKQQTAKPKENTDSLAQTEETHTHTFPKACDIDAEKWPEDEREVCAIFCEECGKLVLNPKAEEDGKKDALQPKCAHDFQEKTKDFSWEGTCPSCKSTLKDSFSVVIGVACIYDELPQPKDDAGYANISCPVCGQNIKIEATSEKANRSSGLNDYEKATLVEAYCPDGYSRRTYAGHQYYIRHEPSHYAGTVCDEDGINPSEYWALYAYNGSSLERVKGMPAYIGNDRFYLKTDTTEIIYDSDGKVIQKKDHSDCKHKTSDENKETDDE